jgi:hypothetical protein
MSYEYLSDPEKEAIKQSAIRSLEYQKYTLEIEKIAELAKKDPDKEKVQLLEEQAQEKIVQILAIKSS